MTRIIILFLFIWSFSWQGYGQVPELNTYPKALVKQLKKFNCGKKVLIEDLIFPSQIDINSVNARYLKINTKQCDKSASYIFIGRVNTCRSGGCLVNGSDSVNPHFEFFDFFILFDDQARVSLVKVFNYEASHGHEITSKRWLRQFKAYEGKEDIVVGKNLDGISGATTSVYNISYEIQERSRRLKQVLAFYHYSSMISSFF